MVTIQMKAKVFLVLGTLSLTSALTLLTPITNTPAIQFATKDSRVPLSMVFDSRNGDKTQANASNRRLEETLPKFLALGMIALSTLLGPLNFVDGNGVHMHPTVPVAAADSRIVGELKGSGLVFKDTLQIESFEDPKVRGVSLYISNFQRPLTERLSKDFFSDPSAAALGCAKTGPVQIADNIVVGKEGEEVFKESKSLLFKSLRVQRLYDKEKNTMVYVLFNTRLDKNDDSNKSRFKSSLCAVSLDEGGSTTAATATSASSGADTP